MSTSYIFKIIKLFSLIQLAYFNIYGQVMLYIILDNIIIRKIVLHNIKSLEKLIVNLKIKK